MVEDPPKYSLNKLFLHSLFISAIIGQTVHLFLNIYIGETLIYIGDSPIPIIVNIMILLGLTLGYATLWIFKKYNLSIIIATVVILATIVFWFFSSSGYYGGVTVTVIIVIGYVFSLILYRTARLYCHLAMLILLIFLLIYQYHHVEQFVYVTHPNKMHILTVGVSFLILYLIIVISSSVLRDKYEQVNYELMSSNREINKMNAEILTQNEELTAQKEELNNLNIHLEQLVELRTASLKIKTDQMAQYSFKNAHNVRGALARILGLINLRKMGTVLSDKEFFDLIDNEAQDMDVIVKQISKDLHKGLNE
jgi:hypothetical protein